MPGNALAEPAAAAGALADAAGAHTLMESGVHIGKIVLLA